MSRSDRQSSFRSTCLNLLPNGSASATPSGAADAALHYSTSTGSRTLRCRLSRSLQAHIVTIIICAEYASAAMSHSTPILTFRNHRGATSGPGSDQNPLDLIQAEAISADGLSPDGIVGAVVQLGRARRLVARTWCGAICCACSIVPPFW